MKAEDEGIQKIGNERYGDVPQSKSYLPLPHSLLFTVLTSPLLQAKQQKLSHLLWLEVIVAYQYQALAAIG